MQLQFKSKHISIEQFDPVDIPDFVVLTGVNGSGKSHLLDAIDKRHVAISGMEQAHIVLFNYETFKLDNEPAFNAHQLSAEREAAWVYHEQQIKNNVQNFRANLGENYAPLKASCQEEKKSFWGMSAEPIKQYRQQFKDLFNNQNIKNNPQAQGIYSLAKKLPYSIDEIQHDEFVRRFKPFVFKNDFLPNQLGKIFWDYYVKYRGNQVNEFENEKYGKDYEVLDEQEFFAVHGGKPWDLINKILEEFDTMHYKINSLEGSDYFGSFQLKLKHTEKDIEIDFGSLSSGEKILMALVASIYKSSSDKHFPDILLLDEVDASLHPSMMKNMLGVIQNVFLSQGVKVILVTHSPTTIALAPEESIYVMNRSGLNRIEKKSKPDALSILTQGFATIEQGLKLFDQVALSNLTIITEGKNTLLIEKYLALNNITDIEVLAGIEGVSGKNQLKTLFDFLSRTDHTNKVIFVWDCDVNVQLEATNNTYPYVLPDNTGNTIAKKGIENSFPPALFNDYKKTINMSNGEVLVEFDASRKRDFESFIVGRNNLEDFANFSSLIEKINEVRDD